MEQAAEAAPVPGGAAAGRALFLRPEPGGFHRGCAGAADRVAGAAGEGPAGARRRLLGGPDFHRDPGAVSRRSTRTGHRPDGEPAEAVADRAEAVLRRIADSLPGGGLAVVVGHGGCLGFGAARLLGLGDELRALGPFGNCRWSVLSRRMGKWRLLEHNAGVLPEPVLEAEAVPDAEPVLDSRGGTRGVAGFLYTGVALRPGGPARRGAIAQLVERLHGMQEVRGSNPRSSTPFPQVSGCLDHEP